MVHITIHILVILLKNFTSFFFICNFIENAEEYLKCHQAVTASLMACADTFNSKLKCQLIKSSAKIEERSERSDVEEFWEKDLDVGFKQVTSYRQLLTDQDFHDVCVVVGSMEADPSQLVIKNQTRLDYFLSEILRRNTVEFELIEVNAMVLKKLDGNRILLLGVNIEVKIELPCTDWLR